MSNAAGIVKKIIYDNESIELTNDIDVNVWLGGLITTEDLQNVGSSTRKVEFRSGKISNISARSADPGQLKALTDLVLKSVTDDQPLIIQLANDDKFSGTVFSTVDPDSWFASAEGKNTFNLVARNGYFVPVS
jgi:hypothetical protein